MPAVGIRCRQFARVGALEDADQFVASVIQAVRSVQTRCLGITP